MDGMTIPALQVNTVYQTLQCEGTWTGTPVVLVRLQGCDVGCPFCDSRETWFASKQNRVEELATAIEIPSAWAAVSPESLAELAQRMAEGSPWVLLTGGEPCQQEFLPFVRECHLKGLKVAVETSGLYWAEGLVAADWVTLSPKLTQGEPLERVARVASEVKHVVGKQADISKLDEALARWNTPTTTPIFLQPMSCSTKALALCVETARLRGWRVSVQVHKLLGLP